MGANLPNAVGFCQNKDSMKSVIFIKENGRNTRTEAQQKEFKLNVLMAVALLKVWGEDYSTFLIGELNQKKKHLYEESKNSSTLFIKEVENGLSEHSKETLSLLTEEITNGLVNLKKDLADAMQ